MAYIPFSGVEGRKLPNGVSVDGVMLGGQTWKQAERTLTDAFLTVLTGQDLVMTAAGEQLTLCPAESNIVLDIPALLAAAQDAPEQELSLAAYLGVNETAVRQKLHSFVENHPGRWKEASWSVEGEVPALDEESFDPEAPCPTLVIHPGQAGAVLDEEALYDQILDALSRQSMTFAAEVSQREPEPLQLDELREAVSIQPINGSLDRQTMTQIPGSYGLDFDSEKAAALLEKGGDSIRIPLEYVAPEVISQDAWFQDVLGFCQTPHSDNQKRTNNLQLACASLNGVVLQPGDVLSYNATLGQRTEENGYQPAPAYSGTELVDTPGGGICQVSSTLYLCALYAGLETVERVSHGYPVSYIPVGTDATVSWGAPDLKLRNGYDYPVKIVAEECDDMVRIWLMGTETRDYVVRVAFSSSSDGYAWNYICTYDRETGEELSREKNHLSSYFGEIDSIVGEIGSDQIFRYGMSREQEIGQPSPETLEAARRCIGPNQYARCNEPADAGIP